MYQILYYMPSIGAFAWSGLKPSFRRIFSSNARKCAWKVCSYKLCTSAASESEFDHPNKILGLKVVVLVYIQCQGYQNVKVSYHSLIYSMVASRVTSWLQNRPWNRLYNIFLLEHARHWERTTLVHSKLYPKPPSLLTAPICSHDRVWDVLSASDRNHANRPVDKFSPKMPHFMTSRLY